MPILGLGIDIVDCERIREICERSPAFLKRVFTDVEQRYSMGKPSIYQHLAARFAAKEATAKALGGPFSWQEVEVINSVSGKPALNLFGRARSAAVGVHLHLSISHTDQYACAVVVAETIK
ncbi:MAG: holo-ACP synthase [Armatimonadota bacterium]|jgi:holo-[acyl-carrier protein] synthase